jgi:uncharacterized protein with PIN domain
MDYDCLVNRLDRLIDEVGLTERQRLLLIEAISDLRASYCSFCNKILMRSSSGITDAVPVSVDKYNNNKMYKCSLCAAAHKYRT